jgi:hypothetical protein
MRADQDELTPVKSFTELSAYFVGAFLISFIAVLIGYFGNTSSFWADPLPGDLLSPRAVVGGTALFLINLLCWNAVVFLLLQSSGKQGKPQTLKSKFIFVGLILLKIFILILIIYVVSKLKAVELVSFLVAFIGCLLGGSIAQTLTIKEKGNGFGI